MPLAGRQKTLVLMLTDRCSQRCRHCFKGLSGPEIPFAALTYGLDEFARIHPNPYVVLSGGEPTVHSRFADVLAFLERRRLTCHIVTNARNFDEVLPVLLAHRAALAFLVFSVDGATAERHDALRAPGSFAAVMRAAAACREHGIPFRFCTTMHRENLDEVEALVSLAREVGVNKGFYLWPAFATPSLLRRDLLLSREERAALVARVEALKIKNILVVGDLQPMTENYQECEFLSGGSYTIDADGNLSVCCNLTRNIGEPTREDVLGAVLEEPMPALLGRRLEVVARYKARLLRDVYEERLAGLDLYPCHHCQRWFGKQPGGEDAALVPGAEESGAMEP